MRGRQVSTMTLLIILVGAAVLLPILLSRLSLRAGFVDIGEPIAVPSAAGSQIRARNSAFLPCRGTGSGPCPEGTFCDGATSNCTPIAMAGI
jgi:hypothetical protein